MDLRKKIRKEKRIELTVGLVVLITLVLVPVAWAFTEPSAGPSITEPASETSVGSVETALGTPTSVTTGTGTIFNYLRLLLTNIGLSPVSETANLSDDGRIIDILGTSAAAANGKTVFNFIKYINDNLDFPDVASVLSSDTVKGSSGTIANCTANDGGTCYVATASKSALDTDLVETNIKSGVTIFGVAGTYAAGGIDGSGTTNYLPKFSAATTLADSIVYELSSNLGISTTNPQAKLHVVNSAVAGVSYHANSVLIIEKNGTAALSIITPALNVGQIMFGDPDGNSQGIIQYDHSNDNLSIYTNGGEAVRVAADGDVGIGETSPLGKLHVKSGDSTVALANAVMDDLVIENNDDAGLSILTPNTSYARVGFGDPEDNFVAGLEYNHNTNDFIIQSNDADVVTIDSSNEVGINIATPDRRFEVLDSTNPQLRLSQVDNTVYADFQVNSNGDLIIGVDGTTNQLVLDNGGGVGVGVANPIASFQVGTEGIADDPTSVKMVVNSNVANANGGGEYETLVLSDSGTNPGTSIIGPTLSFKASTYGVTSSYSTGRILSFFDTSAGSNPGYSGAVLAFQYPTNDNTFTTVMAIRNNRVGIGTISPGYTLETYGTASSTNQLVGVTLQIPLGTTCDSNADGELCHDTSDDQLILDGRVIPTNNVSIWGVTVASTSPAFIDGGLLKVPTKLDGYTMTAIRCSVQGGTSKVIAIEDESANSTEDITCGTSVTSDDGSITNATVTAAEEMYIDFGATSGTVDYVSISVFGTWTRE